MAEIKSDQLTGKDIATIYSLMIEALFEQRSGNPSFDGKDIYEEVLKRFNMQKEKHSAKTKNTNNF
jgi:hypothetical protein